MHQMGTTVSSTPERDELDIVEVLHALADPMRLQILRVLEGADGPVACNEIRLPIAKSTGSHHLKVLREAGVIEGEEVGTRRFYRVRRADLDARFPGLLDSVLSAG
jgi:DNA-binding transcriptional ArsR family regulator